MSLSDSTMDANLKKLLEELPDKPPRSRLEPYLEFIEELRSQGRTYRDIANILAEKCEVRVTSSGVHDFVRTRSRKMRTRAKSSPAPVVNRALATPPVEESSGDDLMQRIVALKARKAPEEPSSGKFEYNPDEPLQLTRPKRE
jgi:hypothetical protein